MGLRDRRRRRVERAKDTARFAGKVLGVAGTVALLGVLWAMLHDAEAENEAALAALVDA